jgi:hypothetical protein
MHLVVIHNWRADSPAVVEVVAEALGMLVFEARQRMAGGGPVVIAKFADPQPAALLVDRLEREDVPALLIDSEELRSRHQPFPVRQFVLTGTSLQLESAGGERIECPYAGISLLLSATVVLSPTESPTTATVRKFSLGKTVLAGGIPMTKKVKQESTPRREERDEMICLYSSDRPFFLIRGTLDFAGLGVARQLTRNLNFGYLKEELRRRAPQALFDDRLLNLAGQVRLLGTAFDPKNHLDLAMAILARTLR